MSVGYSGNKVFCIGFNKTGTSSLHKFFQSLGLKSVHAVYSNWEITDPRFNTNDCFSDGEMHDFINYQKHFPNSKFILTTRALDSWLISRIKHVHYRKSVNATGWMRKEFEKNPEQAVALWIQRREDYHRKVLHHFDNNDLLVLNVIAEPDDEVAKKIKAFLGMELIEINSMYRANVRDEAIIKSPSNGIAKYALKLKSLFIKPYKYDNEQAKQYAQELIDRVFQNLGISDTAKTSALFLSEDHCLASNGTGISGI